MASLLIPNVASGANGVQLMHDRFETFVREAFIKKEHQMVVFFDFKKAYDSTWKYGIMHDLNDFSLKGRLPIFIDDILSNRNFKDCV